MKTLSQTKYWQVLKQMEPQLATEVANLNPSVHLIQAITQAVCSNGKTQVTGQEVKQLSQACIELTVELEKETQQTNNNAVNNIMLQDDKWGKRFTSLISYTWTLFVMLYIMLITFKGIPQTNIRFADTILGFILGTAAATILNYYFGSSKSSNSKDEAMKQMVTLTNKQTKQN
jgi:riboflavin transporter FmnP